MPWLLDVCGAGGVRWSHRRAVDEQGEVIEQADDHLGTFLPTPMLLSVLVDAGRADVAFRCCCRPRRRPGWTRWGGAATTVWQTCAGYTPEGRATARHNRYAFGSVAGWLREGLLGITPTAPGYRRIRISPVIGGGLTSAEGDVETPFGRVASAWQRTGGHVDLGVVIPPGATAEVCLGDGTPRDRRVGEHSFGWSLEELATPALSTR